MREPDRLPASPELRRLLEQAQQDYQTDLENLTDAAVDDIETAVARGEIDVRELVRDYARDASQLANDHYDQLRALWAEYADADMPDFEHADPIDPERALWQVRGGFSNTDYNGLTYTQVVQGRSRAGATIDDLWPDLSNTDDAQQFIADMIAASGRLTMQRNIRTDPTRPRWARVCGGAQPCAFCVMLASRGFAYLSEDTAGLGGGFHDGHCHCSVVPSWGADTHLLARQAQWRDMYEAANTVSQNAAYKGDALSAMRRMYAGTLRDGTPIGISTDSDLYKALDPADMAAVLQRLADSKHRKTARLWADTADRFRLIDLHNGGVPFFSPTRNGISLDINDLNDTRDGHAPYQTLFHETGHMLDWLKGNGNAYYSQTYRDTNGNSFKDLLKQDGDNALKDARKKAWPDIQRQLENIRSEINKRGYAESRYLHRLADIGLIRHSEIFEYMGLKEHKNTVLNLIDDALFEEYVDDRIAMKALADEIHSQGKASDFDVDDILEYALGSQWHRYSAIRHPVGYFDNHSVETEAFAEMLSGHLANENTWRLFVSYFPNSCKMFQDMIRSVAS